MNEPARKRAKMDLDNETGISDGPQNSQIVEKDSSKDIGSLIVHEDSEFLDTLNIASGSRKIEEANSAVEKDSGSVIVNCAHEDSEFLETFNTVPRTTSVSRKVEEADFVDEKDSPKHSESLNLNVAFQAGASYDESFDSDSSEYWDLLMERSIAQFNDPEWQVQNCINQYNDPQWLNEHLIERYNNSDYSTDSEKSSLSPDESSDESNNESSDSDLSDLELNPKTGG